MNKSQIENHIPLKQTITTTTKKTHIWVHVMTGGHVGKKVVLKTQVHDGHAMGSDLTKVDPASPNTKKQHMKKEREK